MKKEKTFFLSFQDVEGNELTKKEITASSKKDAKRIADKAKASSMLNDLKKIIII